MPKKQKKYEYIRKTATINGKRVEAYGKTEREATLKLAEKIETIRRGEELVSGSMTVNAWFEEWMKTYKEPKGLTAKSLGMYREKYRLHIRPRIGNMKLKDVSAVHLQRILNGQKGASESHVKKIRMVLRELFRRARQSRLILYDPSETLELPAVKSGQRRSVTDEERAAILKVARTHKRGLWILTLLYTGMRPGESAALTWDDMDFTRREIHIRGARESGTRLVKTPKTPSGVRDIPIHAQLLPLLQSASDQKHQSNLVFPGYAGKLADDRTLRRWWLSFRRAVDLELGAETYRNQITKSALSPGLTLYCLRHTFATDLQRAGVPINIAKELMGHSSISVTANVYTHRDNAVLHSNMALLDGSAEPSIRTAEQPVGNRK